MVRVSVKGSFKNLVKKLEKKSDAYSSFLVKLGKLLNNSIRFRVQVQGKGMRGRMRKYSSPYAASRERRGFQTFYRDLTITGKMFDSLNTKPIGNNKAVMFFDDEEGNRKAVYNQELIKFYGLTSEERDFIKIELTKFARV